MHGAARLMQKLEAFNAILGSCGVGFGKWNLLCALYLARLALRFISFHCKLDYCRDFPCAFLCRLIATCTEFGRHVSQLAIIVLCRGRMQFTVSRAVGNWCVLRGFVKGAASMGWS